MLKKTKNQKVEIKKEEQNDLDYPEWMVSENEGQLTIDVFQDKNNVYVVSTVAGVKPDDLEISVNNDMLTIRGFREEQQAVSSQDYFFKECFWGSFSRSIILPVDVVTDKISASLDSGVLKITLPKLKRQRKIEVKIK